MKLAESKERTASGRGQVKGTEVERQTGRMKSGKIKPMVCFPLGTVSLFPVTPSTPCKPEVSGVSACGCPFVQEYRLAHALQACVHKSGHVDKY